MTDYKALFDRVYGDKIGGYGSGGGSCEENCWPYLRLVERLITQFGVRRILDIGCGDGQVAAKIAWGRAVYVGVDVCQEALDLHQSRRRPNCLGLLCMNALTDPLPGADLVLVKEMTQHMQLGDVQALLERLTKYPLVLHTSSVQWDTNCLIGATELETRTIDLRYEPFSLPVKTLLEWRCGDDGRFISQLWEPGK